MKRIIFRSPFVTKRDREIAASFIWSANAMAETAVKHANGKLEHHKQKLLRLAAVHMEDAAHRLGFRNVSDMNEYYNRHGKF